MFKSINYGFFNAKVTGYFRINLLKEGKGKYDTDNKIGSVGKMYQLSQDWANPTV